ncbi:MAG: hypothetical protein IPJ87_07970 [Flavobacteriales bacterium]|nr:hypothetical protein [Flavobacteriales bacterium]MBK7941796.1 hypothetical protein [Flavobacteriales bacterium]MBK9700339.1 hypothetical protein [Flavobacteriales bacterium]
MSHRLVLLTNRSRGAMALARALVAEGLDLRSVVVGREPAPEKSKQVIPRLLRATIGDALVNRIGALRQDPAVTHVMRVERRLFAEADIVLEGGINACGVLPGWPPGVAVVETESMNNAGTVGLVRAASPSALVVFGTGILKRSVLDIAPAINAHTSLLPQYRGTRSEFWQCRHDDPAHVGITIHLVDEGVDTGPVLFQRPTATPWPTTPFHLRSLNTVEVIRHMPGVVRAFLEGRLTPFAQPDVPSTTYRNRDITFADRQALFGHLEA